MKDWIKEFWHLLMLRIFVTSNVEEAGKLAQLQKQTKLMEKAMKE